MTVKAHTSNDQILNLRQVAFEGGKTLDLSVGIGSGAFRAKGIRPASFTRSAIAGPNFTCGDAGDIIGIKGDKFCGGIKGGRIYAVPEYNPSIYRIQVLDNGTFRVLDAIPLKDTKGNPVSGLLNPLTVASTEQPLDASGEAGCRVDQRGSMPKASSGCPTARSGSATRTGPRSCTSRPTAGILTRHVPAGHRGRLRRRRL